MLRHYLLIYLFVVAPVVQAGVLKNQLSGHASPYLAMHGQDPVQWQEWNASTVAKAKKQGKLLFVSSGYFSCHWCHVMQRESYQNKKIAAFLNKHFIPVKVDREINAALDARLIDFVENTQGYSGWPLNVFVTPEGFPLVGMVYVPPENFIKVLQNLESQWRQNRNELAKLASQASAELSQVHMSRHTRMTKGLGKKLEQKLLHQTFSMADEMQGGFGEQNKFPSVPQLQVLLQSYQRSKDQRLKKFLQLTLDQMASQGLRDHLGGGFYRYSVDPGWQIPHFEKMLYDNALLAELYLDASVILNTPQYETIGRETLDFILREMSTQYDSFAASLSAIDNKNVEGGYYLWGEAELKSILNKAELQVAKLVWQLEGHNDIEHGHHLIQATDIETAAGLLKMTGKQVKENIQSAQKKMMQARSKRVLPKDHKRIAAWNGLVLSALVRGAKLSGGDVYRTAAQKLQKELVHLFWQDRKLLRTAGKQGAFGQAGLEDYAYISRGLFDWANLTTKHSDWQVLDAVLAQAWQRFYTARGWLLAENMLLRYGAGQALIVEGPMPSPSAILIDITLARSAQPHMKNIAQQALQALNSGHSELHEQPFWHASQINNLVRYEDGLK